MAGKGPGPGSAAADDAMRDKRRPAPGVPYLNIWVKKNFISSQERLSACSS